MIIGIGTDLADIRRVEKTLKRFGERFTTRCFTEIEQQKAAKRMGAGKKVVAGTYAKRFAAKEAAAKALGTGLAQGVRWRDIEVSNEPSGKPQLTLHGRAKDRLASLTPQGYDSQIHITLTDEYPYAQAWVMIDAVKAST